MKQPLLVCLMVLGWALLMNGCAAARSGVDSLEAGQNARERENQARLLAAYPGIRSIADNTVRFSDGSSLPYDDQREKSLADKLENADIQDHFTHPYPAFAPIAAPGLDQDPGRFRCDALLKKLYGSSQEEIEANLVEVVWMPAHSGKRLLFNRNQNAAAQLEKVSRELESLPPEYLKYLVNIDSTYEYRPIQGTNRLSPHSYGIAIDLEIKYTCYWLWDETYHYRNEIPQAVVDAFERHGFVWGGRWYHYDTMHFEYRPEMFAQVW